MLFMDGLKETLDEDFNVSITENGAVGYRTTGKELLDINFSVSSMRNMTEEQIVKKFAKAFYEDKMLAIKWLFYARDAREGIGERRLFRVCMKYLAENHVDIAKALIPLVAEYGRYDDLWCLLDTDLVDNVISLIRKQWNEDVTNADNNKNVSLLFKWLPSPNASSKETKRLAKIIFSKLYLTERQYRKTLAKMRAYLNVVETKMSAKEWGEIDYSAVPSRANLIYNDAFLRNDEVRRREYLDSLQKGETKINASVLFPHDIVHKYTNGNRWLANVSVNTTFEELWKALPDYANDNDNNNDNGNTICISDGSGSMTCTVGNTNISCLDVANSLAIYFAGISSGQFKDKYITFSENPQIVDLSKGKSLKEKIEIAFRYNEVANTNIEKVFDLILQTAINNQMTQDDLPKNILILSD